MIIVFSSEKGSDRLIRSRPAAVFYSLTGGWGGGGPSNTDLAETLSALCDFFSFLSTEFSLNYSSCSCHSLIILLLFLYVCEFPNFLI